MGEFRKIFRKVNGLSMLKQYAKAGVLGFALLETMLLGFSRKSLEIVRLAVEHRILDKLRKQYRRYVQEYMRESGKSEPLAYVHSRTIWVCWMQGMDHAPELVQCCFRSLQRHLADRKIVVITEENYREFVEFPVHIEEKYKKGVISRTHFSDLLRLELLIRYGGTWIDATVLCTGANVPEYILDSDLFVYQCLKPGRDGHDCTISSWLMTACGNHPILMLTRALLYRYWETHNYMKDYYLLHDFFQIAAEAYPEEWKKTVPTDSSAPHILLLNLFEAYDETWLRYVTDMTCFHKMSYKHGEPERAREGTYYRWVLETERKT